MPATIVLLTPNMGQEERNTLASDFSRRLDEGTSLLCFDPLTDDGRPQALQAVTSGRARAAVSLDAKRFNSHILPDSRIPVVVVPLNPDQPWRAFEITAALRVKGVNASIALSWDEAAARIKAVLSPPVLSGKRVMIFGEPFDSATIASPQLSRGYVLERTGVEFMFRPLEELRERLGEIDDSRVKEEAERWITGAEGTIGTQTAEIENSSRLFLLLKKIVKSENLSGVSLDCVRYSFADNPFLPHPCLAFSRLRDEGIAAPCEADACAMLTELFMEGIAQKPAFLGNVSRMDMKLSTVDLLHCVVPLSMEGYGTESAAYRLSDYHGIGRGVSIGADFHVGREVTLGAFSKDLRGFVVWPGKIVETGTGFCRSMARIRIQDPVRFLHSVAGCHYLMVYGNFVNEITETLTRMNVSTTGPMAGSS